MDRRCIDAVEAFCAPGYPKRPKSILIAEFDGMPAEVADQCRAASAIAENCGATGITDCADETERARVWSGRKAAFGAMGRLKPDMLCMDGTIPRAALPQMLERISALSDHYGLICCNVFHAGDGNLHPLIVFDCMQEGELERAEAFGADILKLCVQMGGVLTGEHGVGVEKKALMGEMFSDADLAQQQRLKCAFDPNSQLNPGKVFPVLHACVELGRMHVHDGRLAVRKSAADVSMQTFTPADDREACALIREAAETGGSFEIIGAGTKRNLGRPVSAGAILDVSRLSGVIDYQPEELVFSAKAGTPLAEIEAMLDARNQMLGFEPCDWAPLFGAGGRQTNSRRRDCRRCLRPAAREAWRRT